MGTPKVSFPSWVYKAIAVGAIWALSVASGEYIKKQMRDGERKQPQDIIGDRIVNVNGILLDRLVENIEKQAEFNQTQIGILQKILSATQENTEAVKRESELLAHHVEASRVPIKMIGRIYEKTTGMGADLVP